jgi:hypothetical protein
MSGGPTTLDLWTLTIAVVGALTGVAALAAQIWSHVAAGPRIKVTVANAWSTRDDTWFLSIDASNVGRLPVTILDVGVTFWAEDEWRRAPIASMPPKFLQGSAIPNRLIDGNQEIWFVHPANLALDLQNRYGTRDVRGYVRLATGKTVPQPEQDRHRQLGDPEVVGPSPVSSRTRMIGFKPGWASYRSRTSSSRARANGAHFWISSDPRGSSSTRTSSI